MFLLYLLCVGSIECRDVKVVTKFAMEWFDVEAASCNSVHVGSPTLMILVIGWQ